MKTFKSIVRVVLIMFCFSSVIVNAQDGVLVNWNFENGNDHGFTLHSLMPATPAADDTTVAGDEALTGGWNDTVATNLPQAGVAWVVGSAKMFNGLKPGADPGHARIDADGLLDYSLGKARIGYVNTGSLNTYLLNMHGDFVHNADNDQVASSPKVTLGSNMFLSALSWGGGGALAPAFDTTAAGVPLHSLGYMTGSSGIAVLSAADSSLLASVHLGNKGTLGVDTLDLTDFGGQEVFIEVVDAFQGGWGWLAVDEIQIGTGILELPAPAISQVNWDFENGNDHGFTISSLVPATPAADDPTVAGDESLTGGWEPGNANNLPEAGVAWVVGSPAMINGQKPGADPDHARIDSNGVLDYSLGKARIGFVNTGSLNTYLLNMHGDFVHNADNDQVATSSPILLGDKMFLSVSSWGGGGALAPEFDSTKAAGYKTGSSGIAVLLAADSSFLASVHMGNKGTFGVDTLDLTDFGGLEVIIQVVDAFQGGWGWLAVDEIQIGTEILQLPAPPEKVTWDFENGNDEGFTLSSLVPATPAADDPNTAGDESLTGGWDEANANNLPQAGVTWVAGSPAMFNGQLPGADPANARIDLNGVLDYSLGKARIGPEITGSLNTYLLNMHGDFVHNADNDQIATSPPVLLGDNMWLSALSWGGGGALAPEFDADKEQGYATGSSGIAVLSAADSSLLASVHMGNKGTFGVDSLDLSPFAGLEVIFQVVDAFQGGWGWLAVEKIQIGPEVLEVPTVLGRVAHWKLDETTGTTASDAVGTNNGTLEHMAGTEWVAGASGNGLDFATANDSALIRIPDNEAIKFSTGAFSASYLIKTDITQNQTIFYKGIFDFVPKNADSTNTWYQSEIKGQQIRFAIDDNGNQDTVSFRDTDSAGKTQVGYDLPAYLNNQWIHFVGVRNTDEDSVIIYINGERVKAGWDKTAGPIGTAHDLTLGNHYRKDNRVDGILDDVQFLGYAMSDAEVKAMWDAYGIVTGMEKGPGAVPLTYALGQNYPNPFNPSTTIKFQIPKTAHVTISVYNTLGQRVTTLVNENMKSGTHQVTFDAARFASGIYFYRMKAEGFSQVKKMMLLK